jgi:regulator of protease activity HflC (stomatin/prohibitin superfamily)
MIDVQLLLLIVAVIVALFFIGSFARILREYERAVVFRLGRLVGARGPGIVYVIPGIEKAIRIDLRTITMDIPSQDVITKDNVSLKVNAVLYFRVIDPNRAVVEVQNYLFATSQNAQTTLRSVCGEAELDQLLAEREKINTHLQSIIDRNTEPWGIKVVQVAIKFIDLPEEMRRVMAHQAEAERERRAKVIAAEGEYQAAQRLADASAIMAKEPIALQLRFLQTLVEIASENNSTTIFPVPIDLLKPFLSAKGGGPA